MALNSLKDTADFPLVSQTLDGSVLLDPVPVFLVLVIIEDVGTVIRVIISDECPGVMVQVYQMAENLIHPFVHGTMALGHQFIKAGGNRIANGRKVDVGLASAGEGLHPVPTQIQNDGGTFLLQEDVLENSVQVQRQVLIRFPFKTDVSGEETQGIGQIGSIEIIAVGIGHSGTEKRHVRPGGPGIGFVIRNPLSLEQTRQHKEPGCKQKNLIVFHKVNIRQNSQLFNPPEKNQAARGGSPEISIPEAED
jgi:hypothetical protein